MVKERINITIEESLKTRVQNFCIGKKISFSSLVELLLEQGLSNMSLLDLGLKMKKLDVTSFKKVANGEYYFIRKTSSGSKKGGGQNPTHRDWFLVKWNGTI